MDLQRGVRVFGELGTNKAERVMLSSGLQLAGGGHRVAYAERAVIPKQPWRNIVEEETKILFSRQTSPDERMDIEVIQLPTDVVRPLRSLGLDEARSKPDLDQVTAHPDYDAAIHKIYAFAQSISNPIKQIVWHKLHCSPPGLATVTPTIGVLRLAGLHVDHWDGLSIEQLDIARNRLCINLGTQDRFFLFVNLHIETIRQMIGSKAPERKLAYDSEDRQRNMDTLVYDFCMMFPSYPVIRLQVRPNEAYIAPTECIIHDGSTEGGVQIDIDLMARGYFKITSG